MIPPWVADYIGIPFLARGRTRAGLDCYGLVRLVLAEQFGKDLPAHADGYESMDDRALLALLIDAKRPTINARPVSKVESGDLVLIRYCGFPCHIGLYVGDGLLLHVESGRNTVLEPLTSTHLSTRIEGFYRVDKIGSLPPSLSERAH